jgi:hypothetical protein
MSGCEEMDVRETIEKQGALQALTKHKYIDVILIFTLAMIFTIMILLSTGLI